MTESEKLTLLFTETGEVSDAEWVIKNRTLNQWAIKLMDHQEIIIDLNSRLNKITLTIDLGKIFLDEKSLRLLLNYNSLIFESGGVRFSLSNDSISMLLDLGLDSLTPEVLLTVISNLSDLSKNWQILLENGQEIRNQTVDALPQNTNHHLKP